MPRGVNKKPLESFCIGCGRMYPIDDFYKSPNPHHANGVQPYCRDCGNRLTQEYLKKYGNMEAAIFYTCADMGVPFVRKLFDIYMNRIKDYKSANYWGNYTMGFSANKSKAEKEAWTGFDGTDTDYKDIASIQKSEITYQLESNRTARHHKRETGKKAYKQEYNQGIGKCNEKGRYKIMKVSTLAGRNRADGTNRIATERKDTEHE